MQAGDAVSPIPDDYGAQPYTVDQVVQEPLGMPGVD